MKLNELTKVIMEPIMENGNIKNGVFVIDDICEIVRILKFTTYDFLPEVQLSKLQYESITQKFFRYKIIKDGGQTVIDYIEPLLSALTAVRLVSINQLPAIPIFDSAILPLWLLIYNKSPIFIIGESDKEYFRIDLIDHRCNPIEFTGLDKYISFIYRTEYDKTPKIYHIKEDKDIENQIN